MKSHEFPPTIGAWVRKLEDPEHIGRVVNIFSDENSCEVEVDWGPQGRERVAVDQLGCGLMPGFTIQDEPLSATRKTLGPSTVLAVRRIAECDQALVQLEATGGLVWLPYQSLKRIKEPKLEFVRGEMQHPDAGERWALRVMAHALQSWNAATGALDRLDVDPLPHQIQLVHKILASGHTNWIIADDVGLGKTIEVGLLLAALDRQGRARRVLVISPAGLTRQWQDEMRVKFDRIFEVYGTDFRIDEPWKWKLHDRVIASLDLMKPRGVDDDGMDSATHFGKLLASTNWDLVIFDEAHRLSRTDDGSQTLRFRLARALRERTDALLLLTGTPHQGDTGRFRSLLQLVRPDLRRAIEGLEFQPEIVADIILRNRKIDVTDLDGKFIFRGHDVVRYPVPTTEPMQRLDTQLRDYVRRSYGASREIGGKEGRAIGFVMTIYRKLASSSVTALKVALKRRLERISAAAVVGSTRGEKLEQSPQFNLELESDDLSVWEIDNAAKPFFSDEDSVLRGVIAACDVAIQDDQKIKVLLAAIHQLVKIQEQKVLIFTEYRATQDYLASQLRQLGFAVVLINGSQSIDEKLESVRLFEGDIPILISTEAGGEGFNLHRKCSFLINYDLPWNPARLVQRIGRLYRYGQTRRVKVLNLQARDTIDNEILDAALQRVNTIVNEMAPTSAEFADGDGYRTEILGELLEQLDLSDILGDESAFEVERTKDRIEEAINRAQSARKLQSEILDNAPRFDPTELTRIGSYTTRHVAEFVKRTGPFVGVTVEPHTSNPERFRLRLPDELRGRFSELGGRSVIDATTSRRDWASTSSQTLLDFGSALFRHLVDEAMSPAFGGGYAAIPRERIEGDLLAAFLCRWQNDQGERLDQQLIIVRKADGGSFEIASHAIGGLFDAPVETLAPTAMDANTRKEIVDAARDRVEVDMAGSVTRFRHPNDLILLALAEKGCEMPAANPRFLLATTEVDD